MKAPPSPGESATGQVDRLKVFLLHFLHRCDQQVKLVDCWSERFRYRGIQNFCDGSIVRCPVWSVYLKKSFLVMYSLSDFSSLR